MADREYVSLSIEPAARERLRIQQIRLSAAVGRQLTLSETIRMACAVTTYAEVSGGKSFDVIHQADAEMRAEQSGGCE
jgi:hypothetical protein